MTIEFIDTKDAPAAIGPYAQATVVGGHIYTSGQIPLDASGQLVEGGIEAQTEQVLTNLRAVLAARGAALENVIKTTVFVQDLGDFQTVNSIYASHFGDHTPARSTVQVAGLPLGVLIEIEAMAVIPNA